MLKEIHLLRPVPGFSSQLLLREGCDGDTGMLLQYAAKPFAGCPDSVFSPRHQYREQVLLTPERLEIHVTETDKPIYERILAANKTDERCRAYREALGQGLTSLDGVKLSLCHEKDGALYRGDRLWVPADITLLVDLLKEIHGPPASGHPEFNRMEDLLRRDYYWPSMRKAIRQYVRNCHGCQRTKAFRDRKNGLLTPLAIPLQRWTDISMDFITGLSNTHGHNAICTIIDRLSKERHYVPCTTEDEDTSAEATARILIQYVFQTHGLSSSITSDRGPQFIPLVWQAFYRLLRIKCKLSTAFHPETDIRPREPIRTSKDSCDSTATTCRITGTPGYPWPNSLTTMRPRQPQACHPSL